MHLPQKYPFEQITKFHHLPCVNPACRYSALCLAVMQWRPMPKMGYGSSRLLPFWGKFQELYFAQIRNEPIVLICPISPFSLCELK